MEMKIRDNEILIMNSGAKMSYTELTRCFEIFYTKKASGRGIGLYLAREIVTRQGGYIKVVSELRQGSEFSIMLPVR